MLRKIGRYEVLGELAVGGMAEILLGRLVGPSGFERVVVIKRILPHLGKRPEFVDMFLDEARTVARLNHPNIVQVHELGDDGGELYLVMEYLEGESLAGLLRRLITRGERLDSHLAVHIVAEACRGLHAAHDLTDDGIPLDLVHRDVSPQNLFVTYAGAVKVLDFGIAKAADRIAKTEAGQVKGKFAYMSPEQCAGKALDRRSDIFALGTVLWEALTLTQLFRRPSELATLKAICELPIPRPSSVVPGVPLAIDEAVMRALARRREDRYDSAASLRKDLTLALREQRHVLEPEEELGSVMRRLFADRIEEKSEMLRRARSASGVTSIPSAECDLTVTMPMAVEAADSTGVSSVSVEAAPARPARSRAPLFLAIGAGVSLLGGGATFWALASGRTTAEVGTTGSAASSSAAAPSASVIAPDVSPTASPAAEVALHVESTPSGAKVMRGREELGITPLDTKIPREAGEVEIVLVLAGHLPLKLRLRPEIDQRLVATLQPAPRTGRPPPPRPTGGGIEKLP